jgi:hypothetical protein
MQPPFTLQLKYSGMLSLHTSKSVFAQCLVSPLWRYDHHDGFYWESTRKEFCPSYDM